MYCVHTHTQAQASALRHHRCGLTVKDFNSKTAYRTWRMRALRAARAALLCLQRMPEYNALLEVRRGRLLSPQTQPNHASSSQVIP